MAIFHYDLEQNTDAWYQIRSGIPTSSAISRIITPTGKLSSQAEQYMYDLIAERIMGHPLDGFQSDDMKYGQEMEDEAVAFYEYSHTVDTVRVGFVTTDDGRLGASPDRAVGDSGLLETKCPKYGAHVGYLFKKPVDKTHYPQIQCQLYVTEREWVDILSYNPDLPQAEVHVERDDKFIALMAQAVKEFCDELDNKYAELVERIGLPEVRTHHELTDTELMREVLISNNPEN